MIRQIAGLAVLTLTLGAARSAQAACSFSTLDITDQDIFSSDWSGTQELTDCTFSSENPITWTSDDYTTDKTWQSFNEAPSYGTKESYDASGVYSFHYEMPGYRTQDFTQTWASHIDYLNVRLEEGTSEEAGWSRKDRVVSNVNNNYNTVGSNNYYDGRMTKEYNQAGWNTRDEYYTDNSSYDGAQTVQRSNTYNETGSGYAETGSGQDFGNTYSYTTANTRKSLTAGFTDTVRDGFFGSVLSETKQYFSRLTQEGTQRNTAADGRVTDSIWSNKTVSGSRNVLETAPNGDYVNAAGNSADTRNTSQTIATGYTSTTQNSAVTIASNWDRRIGGVSASGSDFYSDLRQNSDYNYGGNRTVQDNRNTTAARSGSAGSSSYSSWYQKAWTFVNGLLVSNSERSSTSGDASLAAFYANFDPAACEQFKDIANAKNADYSYWGLCLDSVAPSFGEKPVEEEPEPCFGKALGQEKNSKGQEQGKGKGLTKNRCEEPSDSGNGKGKA